MRDTARPRRIGAIVHRVCYHLTFAVHNRDSLAPLRELGVDLAAVEYPKLPATATGLHLFRVTRGRCACDLIGGGIGTAAVREAGRASLAAALATIAALEPRVLAHLTFGDTPETSRRAVGSVEPHDAAAFVSAGRDVIDRWVRLRVPFSVDGPWPRWLDGARVVAVAARRGDDGVLAIVRYPHTPGATLLRCDWEWSLLDTEWFADVAAARVAASGTHRDLRWLQVDDGDVERA